MGRCVGSMSFSGTINLVAFYEIVITLSCSTYTHWPISGALVVQAGEKCSFFFLFNMPKKTLKMSCFSIFRHRGGAGNQLTTFYEIVITLSCSTYTHWPISGALVVQAGEKCSFFFLFNMPKKTLKMSCFSIFRHRGGAGNQLTTCIHILTQDTVRIVRLI